MQIQYAPLQTSAMSQTTRTGASLRPGMQAMPQQAPQTPQVKFGIMNRLPGWFIVPALVYLTVKVITYPIYKPIQLIHHSLTMKKLDKAFANIETEGNRYEYLKGILQDNFAKSADMKCAASNVGKLTNELQKTELILVGQATMRGDFYSSIRKEVLKGLAQSAETVQNAEYREPLKQIMTTRMKTPGLTLLEYSQLEQQVKDLSQKISAAQKPA